MKKWEKLKRKYIGKIGKIFSWIINIGGFFLAILSFVNFNVDLSWGVVLTIVIFNSLFLIIVTVYETLIYKRGSDIEEKILKEKGEEISDLTFKLKFSKYLSDELRHYYNHIILTLNKFNNRLCDVNSRFTVVHEYSKNNQEIYDDAKKNIALMQQKVKDEYQFSILKEYNDFLSNVTNRLKTILDTTLKEKGCRLETSITVKQLSRIVTDPEIIKDVSVITAFRDCHTYLQGKREVGRIKYSLSGNTDFVYCLSHPFFLKNNITVNDSTYDNEHKDFSNHYNCAIVVPIKYEFPDHSNIYGFLTCDILNDDISKINLLDEKMAEILETTANMIGAYFNNVENQGKFLLEDDFSKIIFNLKSDY